MHKAAFYNNSYILTYLRDKHGRSIHEKDDQGNTPLHFACDQKAAFTCFWLIGFGADLDVQNNRLETPMHLLLKNPEKLRDAKTLRELIFRGANKELRDCNGMTPL